MARTKHNTTGRGTHRQRIHLHKLAVKEANRIAREAELSLKLPPAPAVPATFEVTEVKEESNG